MLCVSNSVIFSFSCCLETFPCCSRAFKAANSADTLSCCCCISRPLFSAASREEERILSCFCKSTRPSSLSRSLSSINPTRLSPSALRKLFRATIAATSSFCRFNSSSAFPNRPAQAVLSSRVLRSNSSKSITRLSDNVRMVCFSSSYLRICSSSSSMHLSAAEMVLSNCSLTVDTSSLARDTSLRSSAACVSDDVFHILNSCSKLKFRRSRFKISECKSTPSISNLLQLIRKRVRPRNSSTSSM